MSAIPTASSITMNKASDASVVHETLTVEQITAFMKGTDILDIVKILKATVLELEKKVKAQKALKPVKEKKQKKAGSMPKGVVPKQLRMPRAWVEFVLKHANENGWEPFIISQTKKNKETGEKETEEIEMSGSVFEDSITEACPTGKKAIHKDAMSLSKQYWTCKSQSGTRPDLYEAFEAEYVDEMEAEAEAEEEADVDAEADVELEEDKQVEKVEPVQALVKAGKKVDQKEQKALEAAEKKARDAAEKKEKKDQEAAEKKAKKDQEAAEKKAKKEKDAAEKVAKSTSKLVKASKSAEKKVEEVKEEPIEEPMEEPVEEVKEASKELVTPIKAKPVKLTKDAPIKAKKIVKKDKEPEWTCPDDGNAHPWTFEGKHYMRGFDGSVWHSTSDSEIGEWAGKYDANMEKIDESAPEEIYMDE